jgi:hypothetical protein
MRTEVVAVEIVNPTVVVIVDAVVGNLPGVSPHVGPQVGVGVVGAVVQHRHYSPLPQAAQFPPRLGLGPLIGREANRRWAHSGDPQSGGNPGKAGAGGPLPPHYRRVG